MSSNPKVKSKKGLFNRVFSFGRRRDGKKPYTFSFGKSLRSGRKRDGRKIGSIMRRHEYWIRGNLEDISRQELKKLQKLNEEWNRGLERQAKTAEAKDSLATTEITLIKSLRKLVQHEQAFKIRIDQTSVRYATPLDVAAASLLNQSKNQDPDRIGKFRSILSALKAIQQHQNVLVKNLKSIFSKSCTIQEITLQAANIYQSHWEIHKKQIEQYQNQIMRAVQELDRLRLKVKFRKLLASIGERQRSMESLAHMAVAKGYNWSNVTDTSSTDLASSLLLPLKRLRQWSTFLSVFYNSAIACIPSERVHHFKGILDALSIMLKVTFEHIISGSGEKGNPIQLSFDDLKNMIPLLSIQHLVRGNFPSLLLKERKLLKCGRAKVHWAEQEAHNAEEGLLFLFSDSVLWTGRNDIYHGTLGLRNATAIQLNDSSAEAEGGEFEFSITKEPENQETRKSQVIVVCDSQLEIEDWLRSINRCARDIRNTLLISDKSFSHQYLARENRIPIARDYGTGDDEELVVRTKNQASVLNRYLDPVIILDVDVGKYVDRCGPIVIHQGDTALQLSELFIKRTGLSNAKEYAKPLAKKIETITSIYSKMVERRRSYFLKKLRKSYLISN